MLQSTTALCSILSRSGAWPRRRCKGLVDGRRCAVGGIEQLHGSGQAPDQSKVCSRTRLGDGKGCERSTDIGGLPEAGRRLHVDLCGAALPGHSKWYPGIGLRELIRKALLDRAAEGPIRHLEDRSAHEPRSSRQAFPTGQEAIASSSDLGNRRSSTTSSAGTIPVDEPMGVGQQIANNGVIREIWHGDERGSHGDRHAPTIFMTRSWYSTRGALPVLVRQWHFPRHSRLRRPAHRRRSMATTSMRPRRRVPAHGLSRPKPSRSPGTYADASWGSMVIDPKSEWALAASRPSTGKAHVIDDQTIAHRI